MNNIFSLKDNNKATSLSMSTIIIAAISIVVLLILIYLVVNHLSDADKATDCNRKGGICIHGTSCSDSLYSEEVSAGTCPSPDETCCKLPVGG